jgi:hypothetical protein
LKKLILFIFLFILIYTPCNATFWYVDNAASGTNDGTSWTNAWDSFASISWASVGAGDTVYISGGSTTKTYSERLIPGKGGSAGSPITIKIGQDSGHNGVAIISPASNDGVSLDYDYLTLSGRVGTGSSQNIKIQTIALGSYGIHLVHNNNFVVEYIELTDIPDIAIRMDGDSSYVTPTGELSHLKIYDCSNDSDAVVRTMMFITTGSTDDCSGVGCVFDKLLIHDCEFYNFIEDPISLQVHQASVYNCSFHDRLKEVGVTDPHSDAIQIWSSYVKVYNNTTYNMERTDSVKSNSFIRYNPGDASKFYKPSNLRIYNNLVYETAYNASSYYRGIELAFSTPVSSVTNIIVANNTFVGIPYFGIFAGFHSGLTTSTVSGVVIENNIFKNMGRNGAGVISTALATYKGDGTITWGSHGQAVDVVLDNNLIYASSGDYTTECTWAGDLLSLADFKTTSGTMANAVSSDPLLTASYALSSLSPAINTGTDLSTYFTSDKNGTTRPQNGAWDMGAYEYIITGAFTGSMN